MKCPSDIEARARAYGDKMWPAGSLMSTHAYGCYLAGARAEVELERKRILEAVEKLTIEPERSFVRVEELKKIIGGA